MSVVQIAKRAGVSIATVSRVMNNSRPVRPEVADAVRRAAAELQMTLRPTRKRSKPSGKRISNIAIVSLGHSYRTWFQVPIIASVVAELTQSAQSQEIGVLIAEMLDPKNLDPVLKRPDIEGAIVFLDSQLPSDSIDTLQKQMPVVRVMGGQISSIGVDHVGTDNNAVGYLGGKYLIDKGLTNLAFFTRNPEWDFVQIRAQGFLTAAQEAGITPTMYLGHSPLKPLLLFGPGPLNQDEPPVLFKQLSEKHQGKVGLFVSRDEELPEVYRLLRENHLEPGRDIVVVSCDNEQVRLSSLHPKPASIDLSVSEIARRAINRLAQRIQNRNEYPVRILVKPQLVME